MSQRERPAFRRPREADLEKRLRPEYREYEEWRTAQAEAIPVEATDGKPERKRFRITRLDVIFVALGLVAAWVFQSCNTPQ